MRVAATSREKSKAIEGAAVRHKVVERFDTNGKCPNSDTCEAGGRFVHRLMYSLHRNAPSITTQRVSTVG